jgi:hypothetical protein
MQIQAVTHEPGKRCERAQRVSMRCIECSAQSNTVIVEPDEKLPKKLEFYTPTQDPTHYNQARTIYTYKKHETATAGPIVEYNEHKPAQLKRLAN